MSDMGIWGGLVVAPAKPKKKRGGYVSPIPQEPYKRGLEADKEIAERVRKYLEANPYASQKQLKIDCKVSIGRCQRLVREGLLPRLPFPQNYSIAGTKSRAGRRQYETFRLPGSPDLKEKRNAPTTDVD